MSNAGFDSAAPTFVSWLGVTQYLTRDAIDTTLRWAAGLAKGSEIVLTYVVPSPEAEAARLVLAQRGTRFETFFEPAEMGAVLTALGLRPEGITPQEIEGMYFRGRDDGLHASTSEWLMVGIVT